MFTDLGGACLREFTLKTGRRADLVCLDRDSQITLVEVKSSRQDFISDRKWPDYFDWADRFYFAVAQDFPADILPGASRCGIILSDGFDSLIVRTAPHIQLPPARRSHIIRRLAHTAMTRCEAQLQTRPISG